MKRGSNSLPARLLCAGYLLALTCLCGGRGARAGEDEPTYFAAVRTVDHEGSIEYAILQVSRSYSPPEVKELKAGLDAAYDDAREKWREDRTGPRPQRPTCVLLRPVVQTREEAEALVRKEKAADLDRADPGRAARQKILRERFLDHFVIGVEAPLEWIIETRRKHGARWDLKGGYLSGSAKPGETGDDQWFFKYGMVERTLRQAHEANVVIFWTWYCLANSYPAFYKPGPAKATPVNMKVPETMRSYFEIFKRLVKTCAKYPDQPVVLQIEPDEWGHMLLTAGMDPEKVDVKVGSTGMPEIEDLPDNLIGYAKALKRLRDMYAPNNVLLCANPSAWDWRGSMTPGNWARVFEKCGVFDWELAVYEFGDRDIGMAGKQPPYSEEDVVTRFRRWDALLGYLRDFHERTGLWVVMWQVAMGNTYFRTCNNVKLHYCDGLAEGLLEDYPQNDLISRLVKAGCCGWVFLPGQWQDGTHVYDAAKDGITNPEPIPGNKGHVSEYPDDDGGYMRLRGANYYKQPCPILGKPRQVASRKGKREKSPPIKRPEPERKRPKPGAVEEWDAKLRARIGEDVAAGKKVGFSVAAFQQRFEVMSVDAAGTLELKGAVTEMSMEWPRLTPADKKSLALAMLREGDAGDHCLAAFYLIVAGDEEEAEDHLAKGGGGADGVEASFVTVGGETVAGGASPAEGAEDGAKPAEDREPRARPVPRPTTAEEKPVRREADAALAKLYQEAETAFIDGDVDNAKALFEKIVEEHPDSPFAPKAKEYLEILE